MSKFNIKSLDPFEIEILEDLKKGEVLNLSTYFNEDSISLNNLINQKVNQQYQKQLENQKNELIQQFEKEFKLNIENEKLKLTSKLNEKEKDLKILLKENQEIKEKTILEQQNIFNQERNKLINNNNELKNKNELLENKLKTIEEKVINEQEIKFHSDLKQKDIKINDLNNQINLINKQHENQLIKLENEISNKYQQELNKKQSEIDELSRNRNLLGTKDLGNELEDYCRKEIVNNLIDPIGNDGSIILDQAHLDTNKEKNTKADFTVIYKSLVNKDLEFKIVLEMKTESLISRDENKKKNADHLKKLIKDAESEDANVAILVTELEKDDKFLVRRIDNKQFNTDIEIYYVRPELLVYLLSILRIVFLKYVDINYNNDFIFKTKEEVYTEFDNFKNELITLNLKKINDNLEKIRDNATKISKYADAILDEVRVIIDSHISAMENKINNFKIESKIIKKLDVIETKQKENASSSSNLIINKNE